MSSCKDKENMGSKAVLHIGVCNTPLQGINRTHCCSLAQVQRLCRYRRIPSTTEGSDPALNFLSKADKAVARN